MPDERDLAILEAAEDFDRAAGWSSDGAVALERFRAAADCAALSVYASRTAALAVAGIAAGMREMGADPKEHFWSSLTERLATWIDIDNPVSSSDVGDTCNTWVDEVLGRDE